MKTFSTSLFAAACVAAAAAAHALPRNDKLSVELFAGGNVATPGSFAGQTASLQTTDPAGELTYHDLKLDDAYGRRLSAGAEVDYSFDSHVTAFARAAYNEFRGDHVTVGRIEPGARMIGADFTNTDTRELDLGARYTFMAGEKWRPFLGAALGATRLAATRVDVDNPDGLGSTLVHLGDSDTVFMQRLETGVQFSPARTFDLRLTAAANHVDGERRSNDPNLALLGFDNPGGEVRGHWDYPAELGAVWHF